jgi:hypothetical protein
MQIVRFFDVRPCKSWSRSVRTGRKRLAAQAEVQIAAGNLRFAAGDPENGSPVRDKHLA